MRYLDPLLPRHLLALLVQLRCDAMESSRKTALPVPDSPGFQFKALVGITAAAARAKLQQRVMSQKPKQIHSLQALIPKSNDAILTIWEPEVLAWPGRPQARKHLSHLSPHPSVATSRPALVAFNGLFQLAPAADPTGPCVCIQVYTYISYIPKLPNVPLSTASWSLSDGIRGVLKGGCWCVYIHIHAHMQRERERERESKRERVPLWTQRASEPGVVYKFIAGPSTELLAIVTASTLACQLIV